MPTFDFQCQDCSHIFEHARPFGNTEVPPCPKCESANTKKLIAPPAIHFKGKGFYKTDSKKPAPKPKKEEKATDKKTEKSEKSALKPESSEKKSSQKSEK